MISYLLFISFKYVFPKSWHPSSEVSDLKSGCTVFFSHAAALHFFHQRLPVWPHGWERLHKQPYYGVSVLHLVYHTSFVVLLHFFPYLTLPAVSYLTVFELNVMPAFAIKDALLRRSQLHRQTVIFLFPVLVAVLTLDRHAYEKAHCKPARMKAG